MNMKCALCSFVLLIAMSTTGLLIGSKSASAASITIDDRLEDFAASEWKGSWEGDQYGTTGRAELYLVRTGDSTVRAEISIHGSGVYWGATIRTGLAEK